MSKVTVIGAGHVGATVAHILALKNLVRELVLLDVVEGMPQGKALDLFESTPVLNTDTRLKGSNDFGDSAGSDVIVITAGLARKPGMSRDDLLKKNADIIRSVSEQAANHSPQGMLIVVTNPLDVMTYVAWRASHFEPHRVFGQAGILDSARFRTFLSLELGVSVRDIQAMVLGGHGDDMVPLPRYTTVGGIPITQLVSPDRLEDIIERTRKGGGEIVSLLKQGSAYYAPGAATAEMVEAVLTDAKRVLPCSAWLTGQFGIEGTYAGVPVLLGRRGIERIVEIDLSDNERRMLHESADHVKRSIAGLS